MNDGANLINESAGQQGGARSNATIELKPQVRRVNRKPAAGIGSVEPLISSDQLAARVTIRRINRSRAERRYVLLLGHRSEITGIRRRAYEAMTGASL